MTMNNNEQKKVSEMMNKIDRIDEVNREQAKEWLKAKLVEKYPVEKHARNQKGWRFLSANEIEKDFITEWNEYLAEEDKYEVKETVKKTRDDIIMETRLGYLNGWMTA